jgi:hypothetical protein
MRNIMALIQIQTHYGVYGSEARDPIFVNTSHVEYLQREPFGDYGISTCPDGYLAISRDEFKRLKPLFVKAMADDEQPTAIAVFNRECPEWSCVHIVHQGKAEEALKRLQEDEGHTAIVIGLVDERRFLPPDPVQIEIAELKRKLAESERLIGELKQTIQTLSLPAGKARAKAYKDYVDRLIADADPA